MVRQDGRQNQKYVECIAIFRSPLKNGVNRRKRSTPTAPNGETLPQGIVVGCTGNTTALVDTGDVHVLMIGAAGSW